MSISQGLDHIDLVVEDIAIMRDFLVAVGFEVVRETDHGGGAIELRVPGGPDQPIVELTSQIDGKGNRRPIGLRHLALRVGDMDGAVAEYTARGLRIDKPPRVIPETGRRLVNLIDPAGGSLQLVEG